jgi:predicted enzyme related to lactoylglutathione lyase
MAYSPINTVLWLDIAVVNLDRAKNFYQALLNIDGRDSRPQTNSVTFQYNQQGSGLTLILQSDVTSGNVTPYLNCHKRLDQALAQVKLNGGKILQEKHSMEPFGYRAVILDSENNRIALHSAE